ncbi:uncharacterized protein TNIN_76461 [Trichonephila inaurata madagascariensis]|uniref:Uncharacterized protein n=1 Tax=Trichonephila inaurata madagascariensis TaxID=2747483 RepID=A0A8X7CIM9_9ARAC|nr:uncharacterized protein TNIN_76461 [Trichonephila inaurata madagascariensis]
MYSLCTLFSALTSAYREDQRDVDKYMDEVLSVQLPRHIENADLDVYEMPDFYFNIIGYSAANEEYDGTVAFHRGNLTGFSAVHRRFCQLSLRSTDSSSIICNIILPRIDVRDTEDDMKYLQNLPLPTTFNCVNEISLETFQSEM